MKKVYTDILRSEVDDQFLRATIRRLTNHMFAVHRISRESKDLHWNVTKSIFGDRWVRVEAGAIWATAP